MLSSQMPIGSVSMQQAYNHAIRGNNGLMRSRISNAVHATVSRLKLSLSTRDNIYSHANTPFPRLLNPSIVMYIYPHQAGSVDNPLPVPGYSTVFPLYQHVYYALPGEVATH